MSIGDIQEYIVRRERESEELVVYDQEVQIARISTLVDGTIRVTLDLHHSGSEKEMGEKMSLLYRMKHEHVYLTLLNRVAKRKINQGGSYEETLQEEAREIESQGEMPEDPDALLPDKSTNEEREVQEADPTNEMF